MAFSALKKSVAAKFGELQQHRLFRTGSAGDEIWAKYLESFPNGTNPILRERTEHDCSACRSFVKSVGNVVAIVDGKIHSIWDLDMEEPYRTVAERLAEFVKSRPIHDAFLHDSRSVGVDKNFEDIMGSVTTWEHLSAHIEKRFIEKKDQIPAKLGEIRSTQAVLLRSLTEIDFGSIDSVLELIGQNSLYRGEENRFVLESFRKLKVDFENAADGIVFSWTATLSQPPSVTKIRSTAIGTLLVDLSEGKDLDQAVASFESKVAPTNYRRPTALVTKAMIQKAKAQVEELGLAASLERRFATSRDLSVNDILFTGKTSPGARVSGDVFDELAGNAPTRSKDLSRVEEINIDKFIVDVIPSITSVDVLLENRHAGNMVSLVAPCDPTAPGIFKWGNKFSWSYAGELADSIKERVKKAGGSVEGDVCIRLAWHNHDDLDLHMAEPGYEIYYGNRNYVSPSGGRLDVDMNAGCGTTREPVENIFYSSKATMKKGTYTAFVHNFCARESTNIGFEVEADILGQTISMSYGKPVKDGERIDVMRFEYDGRGEIKVISSLPSSTATRTMWGLPSQVFHSVSAMLLSPNHWGDRAIGNKHFMFMLEGCKNDGTARGFFNEFLKDELNAHRKVFELVGSKLKLVDSDEQLSGLGFSSTQRNSIVCKVRGSFSRTLKVLF